MAGASTLTVAFLPGTLTSLPFTLPPVAGVPGNVALVAGAGLVLLGSGAQLLRKATNISQPAASPQPVEEKPRRKTRQKQRKKQRTTSPTGTTVDRTGSRAGAETKADKRMSRLEASIKEIDRRMSQAKVKLGTGELSPEGYQKVMDELQEKRAQLEKRRVDIELDQSDI